MYAVIQTGGKQYRVTKGEIIKVERLEGEFGQSGELKVLAVNNDRGLEVDALVLSSALVAAEMIDQT